MGLLAGSTIMRIINYGELVFWLANVILKVHLHLMKQRRKDIIYAILVFLPICGQAMLQGSWLSRHYHFFLSNCHKLSTQIQEDTLIFVLTLISYFVYQIMMQSNCYAACSNFSLLNGYRRRPLPYTNISISKVLTKKISATTGNVFKWANSEDNDSSSLALTPNFILPVERRPNLTEVSKTIHKVPIIDMASGEFDSHIEEIASACEDYGLFLIKNHGVQQELCDSMLSAATDLFHLPPQTKALLVSDNPAKDVRICNHYRKVEDKDDKKPQRFSMWSEVFKHPWHPTDDSFAALLPSDPADYRY